MKKDEMRCWLVTVGRSGKKARPLHVRLASRRIAETVALNVPRMLAKMDPTRQYSVRVVETTAPSDPAWPLWKVVTSRRMVQELPGLLAV